MIDKNQKESYQKTKEQKSTNNLKKKNLKKFEHNFSSLH